MTQGAAAVVAQARTNFVTSEVRVGEVVFLRSQFAFLCDHEKSSLKKLSKSQTARERACAEQNAYRPAWQLVRAVACAILYALGVTCARAMSPRVKQNGSHLSKK